jgi:hypothetical protein
LTACGEYEIDSVRIMSATASHPAGLPNSDHLTFRYTSNPDGWVTAQIEEFPEAISQGETEVEARANVLEALHDLTHHPTLAERAAFTIQAMVDGFEQFLLPVGGKVTGALAAALDRTHDRSLR